MYFKFINNFLFYYSYIYTIYINLTLKSIIINSSAMCIIIFSIS